MLHHNLNLNIFQTELITVTNPAAGANFSYTVPNRTRLQLAALRFSLVTDATVTNRTVRVVFDDGTTTFLTISASQDIPASVTRHLNFFIGMGISTQDSSGEGIRGPLPTHLYLQPGYRITSTIRAIQAADQISAIVLYVNKWIQVN